jgi:hypothetical protein|tara:strand:- start:1814 stop:2401 length:588 start_codon:yes stop_codon:yes gene_type:complete
MKEIFKKLADMGITPNAFYILDCVKEGIVPNTYVKASLEVTRLIKDNWLTQDLELTDKSVIFTTEIDGYFKRSKKKTSTDLLGHNFMQNIEAYVHIFPNKKLSSGKYARVPAKNLESGFRWFFETYDYDWETIFQATQKYVGEYESKNFEYMRTAQYFLRKQNVDKSWDSDLATYCEYLKDSPDDEQVYFSELIV